MSKSWPLFVYLRPFLVKISIQIEKSTDGVLGIRTRGRRRNHGAMAATQIICKFVLFVKVGKSQKCK